MLNRKEAAIAVMTLTLALLAMTLACSAGASPGSTSPLSSAVTTASTASGTLLCSPSQAQLDACSGKAANDACTLAPPDGGTGFAGKCLTTIDGAALGCVPAPPAPPQPAIDACASKSKGDACTVQARDGDTLTGVCATPPDQTVVACVPVRTPPQFAIDACSGKAAGDACTLPDPRPEADGGTETHPGTCSNGPADNGPLACAPARDFLPDATEACAGLTAGASCTLGERDHSTTGTCTTPAAGGDAVCVVACSALGGHIGCGGGPGGPGGGPPGGPGGGPGGHH